MDKKILIGIIGEKLEIMQEQFAIIREYEGKIPSIEIDLLMSNIRDLYDLFINLNQENQALHSPEPYKKTVSSTVPVPPTAAPDESSGEIMDDSEPAFADREESPEEAGTAIGIPRILAFEPVIEPEMTPGSEQTLPEESPVEQFIPPVPEEPVHPAMPEAEVPPPLPDQTPPGRSFEGSHEPKLPRTTFDLFSDGSSSTLADRYRDNNEKRVADRLSENKVTDLRNTIGINDKFLFINELFEGNMRIYEEAIRKLNDCVTLAQADMLLLDLKIVYNWDSESPTVKKFVDLVRRKF